VSIAASAGLDPGGEQRWHGAKQSGPGDAKQRRHDTKQARPDDAEQAGPDDAEQARPDDAKQAGPDDATLTGGCERRSGATCTSALKTDPERRFAAGSRRWACSSPWAADRRPNAR